MKVSFFFLFVFLTETKSGFGAVECGRTDAADALSPEI